jgi:hypothetical protein
MNFSTTLAALAQLKLAGTLSAFVGRTNIIPTTSTAPTIPTGTRLIMDDERIILA